MISGMQALGAKTGGSISNMAAIKKTARDRVGSWKPTTVLCMVSGYKADNYCFSAERVDTGCGSQENHSWARLRVQGPAAAAVRKKPYWSKMANF